MISNNTLYKRCSVAKLSDRVSKYRWRMLGHILRSDENTAAQLALTFSAEADKHLTGRIGRPRSNLSTLIKNDLNQRNLKINSIAELNDVTDIATCRERWKNLF